MVQLEHESVIDLQGLSADLLLYVSLIKLFFCLLMPEPKVLALEETHWKAPVSLNQVT